MKKQYYAVTHYGSSHENLISVHLSEEEAILSAINFFASTFDIDSKFLELNSIDEMLSYVLQHNIYISRPINEELFNFDFNIIKNIKQYKIIENKLITNIGLFLLSKEEIEKFQKLIIFK